MLILTDNFRVAIKLVFLATLMFAFGYAMVPLYEKFCQVTGINNLLNPATDIENISVDVSREIRVEFVTSAVGDLEITPNIRSENFNPGKTYSVIYTLRNLSDKTLFGQAIPSYSPARSESWFKKVQCFCFEQLRLEPHQTLVSPVVFILDDQIPNDINTLALAYTFFEVEGAGF